LLHIILHNFLWSFQLLGKFFKILSKRYSQNSKRESWPTKSAIDISITCRKISNSPLSIKYPQQQTFKWGLGKFILKKKCSTLKKKYRFGHTSFIKVVINGTIATNSNAIPHEGSSQVDLACPMSISKKILHSDDHHHHHDGQSLPYPTQWAKIIFEKVQEFEFSCNAMVVLFYPDISNFTFWNVKIWNVKKFWLIFSMN